MLSLAEAQANFIDTINGGPEALDPVLFAGPVERVLLGLKAHANTISHAKLVALEQTFPLTRREMGEAAFNVLSRGYAETAAARAADGNSIGQHFPDFLREQSLVASLCELAEIEWYWLQSYHAADAIALTPADLAGLDEGTLLTLPVNVHPSVRLIIVTVPLAAALEELAGQQPKALAIVRPDAEVRLWPLNEMELPLAQRAAEKKCTLGNLIELSLEQADERAPMESILYLIGAGALIKAG
jgi:hypothetical protein